MRTKVIDVESGDEFRMCMGFGPYQCRRKRDDGQYEQYRHITKEGADNWCMNTGAFDDELDRATTLRLLRGLRLEVNEVAPKPPEPEVVLVTHGVQSQAAHGAFIYVGTKEACEQTPAAKCGNRVIPIRFCVS